MLDVIASSSPSTATPHPFRVVFCETCEQLIFLRSLLDDPRHQTRSQSIAVTRLLGDALNAVERELTQARQLVYQPLTGNQESAAAASLGVVAEGLRQVQTRLGLLETRWPHGTADLFFRKLAAEGVAVPVPTVCVGDDVSSLTGEVGAELGRRLAAVGLPTATPHPARPILELPGAGLVDPLVWAGLFYPLAMATVERHHLDEQLHRPVRLDPSQYRRLCAAAVAASLVGEPTYAALAARALVAGWGCGPEPPGLAALAAASDAYARPVQAGDYSLAALFTDCLRHQRALRPLRGSAEEGPEPPIDTATREDIDRMARTIVPPPELPDTEEMAALTQALDDGRPINARPPALAPDFAQRLAETDDAPSFYRLIDGLGERPCSLAAILGAGWRYKILRTYPLCDTLMAGPLPMTDALPALGSHVLERCGLLQQSIEASYVHQVLARNDAQ